MDDFIMPRGRLITPEQLSLVGRCRRLWLELAIWVRDLAITTMWHTERLPSVANQLFVNLVDEFYQVFNLYYDSQISQRFINLLSSFLRSAWGVMQAMKENNQDAVNTNMQQLYQSVDDISNFLSQINYFWDADQWRYLLNQYIRLKVEQITDIARGEFEREVALYNRIEDIAVLMGSYMARGLISASQAVEYQKQFNAE